MATDTTVDRNSPSASGIPDIRIIGGGVVGLSIARACAQAGLSVVVHDAASAGQASWAAGGILWPLGPWRYAPALYAHCQAGRALQTQLCAELLATTGIDPEYWQCGVLLLEEPQPQVVTAWAAAHNEPCEPLSQQAVQQRHPHLQVDAGAHYHFEQVAQLRPPRLLAALRADVCARGVQLLPNSVVKQMQDQGGQVLLELADGSRLPCGRAVIAAGAWSAALLPAVHAAQRGLQPVRGQMLCYRARPGLLNSIVMQGQHYLIPRRDGRILAGSSMEHVGFDASTTAATYNTLKAFAERLLPELAQLQPEQHWAGLRPGSPQGLPWVEAVQGSDAVFLATGHYRYGITQAPATAQQMLELIQQSG